MDHLERGKLVARASLRQPIKRKGPILMNTTGYSNKHNEKGSKQQWEPMNLFYLGKLRQVVQGGGGKLTQVAGDPGETRKQRGGE